MKKIIKLTIFLLLLMPIIITNVDAASVPYQWNVGGEKVNVGQPNQNNTATLEKDGNTVILHLNNYNGGNLILECYGTGQSNMTFIIDLTGTNTIEGTNIGIDMGEENDSIIKFQGSGNLTITAPKPISYETFTNKAYVSPSTNQYGEQNQETKVTGGESTQEDMKEDLYDVAENDTLIGPQVDVEPVKNGKNNQTLIIFTIFAILSTIIIITLVVTIIKMKKNVN